jgi:hypothetical protein
VNQEVVGEEPVPKRLARGILHLERQALSNDPDTQPDQPRHPRLVGVEVVALVDFQAYPQHSRRIR